MYRVVRTDKYVRVYRLSEPDAIGNRHWIELIAIPADAITEDGRRVKDLLDEEILRLVRT